RARTRRSEPGRAACPAARMKALSAIRAGSSLKSPPPADPLPPSTATIPSSRLHRSRSWMQSAQASSVHGAPETLRAAAPSAANTTLASEIGLGVIEVRARAAARDRAQPLERLLSGRRLAASVIDRQCNLSLS